MADSTSSSILPNAGGLLLRVRRQDGETHELYLADGLTIGRGKANTVEIPNETVDRSHARVEFFDGGRARLRCLNPSSRIQLGTALVKQLELSAGTTFRIGEAVFECVAGFRNPFGERITKEPKCPFCGSTGVQFDTVARACSSCGEMVIGFRVGSTTGQAIIAPQMFGRYKAERYVARGGMGIVLKGLDDKGKFVAIKLLIPKHSVERQAAERFKHEILMLKRVRHPNVVRLLDFGKAGRINYLVMDWIEGATLREVIIGSRETGVLVDFSKGSKWFEQVVKGLAAIHQAGIIHRDIKPSNVLIEQNGRALISDLGIAKDATAIARLSDTGQNPGTVEYMAPEQLEAPDTVDKRADFYSLGLTFYEALALTRPVGSWMPASKRNSSVPGEFDAVIARLLSPSPNDRPSDESEIMRMLTEAIQSKQAQTSGTDAMAEVQDHAVVRTCSRCGKSLSDKAGADSHRCTSNEGQASIWSMIVVGFLLYRFRGQFKQLFEAIVEWLR